VPFYKKLNDEQLVSAIKSGDRQALLQLYRDNYMSVRNYISKNNGRQEDAEDILQDACVAVWEKIRNNSLELNARLTTLVFAISKNLWLKRLRKDSRQSPLSDVISETYSEESDLFDSQDLQLVVKMMNSLGEKCRMLLKLFYFDRRDMKEIAQIMEYNHADTAKAKKHQCFKQLQENFLSVYKKSDFWEN